MVTTNYKYAAVTMFEYAKGRLPGSSVMVVFSRLKLAANAHLPEAGIHSNIARWHHLNRGSLVTERYTNCATTTALLKQVWQPERVKLGAQWNSSD